MNPSRSFSLVALATFATLLACAGGGAEDDSSTDTRYAPSRLQTSDLVIAAARTPDGRALPQSSLANGQCPPVVALLGSWSCLSVNDECTFQNGGVTQHCTCVRVDGEGQYPAWSCN